MQKINTFLSLVELAADRMKRAENAANKEEARHQYKLADAHGSIATRAWWKLPPAKRCHALQCMTESGVTRVLNMPPLI